MSRLKKLALVGRPNVGKSALFNRICGKRIAIVDEAEGITRDRLYAEADFFNTPFEVIDTGGIDRHSKATFNEEVKRQAEIAIAEADTIIMVVDGRTGPTSLDDEVARILLSTQKPVCLAVNKIDHTSQEVLQHTFYRLGIQPIITVSAIQGLHIAELLEAAFHNIDMEPFESNESEMTKVALIGRPNVGKSSLMNYLLNEERCVVSPIPGTTRDSIDALVSFQDQVYTFIDTAGIRRKPKEHEAVDKFAALRTERAMERSNICLLMLDAREGITAQEKKIANSIEESGKGCVVLLNKWDLVKGFQMEHILRAIKEEAPFLGYCPLICISATSGRNVEKIFPAIDLVTEQMHRRIPTHQLNKFIGDALQKNHPSMIRGKRLRIYYMTQVQANPPHFVLFVNYPDLMEDSYKRYLYNQFREEYQFQGTPITMRLQGKRAKQIAEESISSVTEDDQTDPEGN